MSKICQCSPVLSDHAGWRATKCLILLFYLTVYFKSLALFGIEAGLQ